MPSMKKLQRSSPWAVALLTIVLTFGAVALPSAELRADTLREVAERVARQNDARVVSARVVERGGKRFYEIRIMTRDGVVRTVRVPAERGRAS